MARDYPYDVFEDVVASFYVLEATILELEKRQGIDLRFPPLLVRAKKYRTRFHRQLARTMRDALMAMCFGEARHARAVARTRVWAETQDGSYKLIRASRQSREQVYQNVHRYATSDILRLKEIFQDEAWDGSFGGKAWAELCDRVMQYEQLSPTIYCDLMFHVVHNGGCAFSKGFLLSYRHAWLVKRCLDMKFEDAVELCADDTFHPEVYHLSPTVYEIYEKTRYLIFVLERKEWGSNNFRKAAGEFKLQQVNWNPKPNLTLVEDEDWEPPNNYDEEDGYYGEEEVETMGEKPNVKRDGYTVQTVPRREPTHFR